MITALKKYAIVRQRMMKNEIEIFCLKDSSDRPIWNVSYNTVLSYKKVTQ